MNAMAEPEPWSDRGIGSAGRDELPEFRSDLGEDGGPLPGAGLPEQPGAPVPRRIESAQHPPPLGNS